MNWRLEALNLIEQNIAKGEAFSAAHIAQILRKNRATAAFDLDSLSEHIRGLFYAGTMGEFVQVAHKQGFAYAPTVEAGRKLSVVVRVPSREVKASNPFIKSPMVSMSVAAPTGAAFAAVHLGQNLHIQRSTIDAFYRITQTTPQRFAVDAEPGAYLRLVPSEEGPAEVSNGSLLIPITSEPGTQYPVSATSEHIEVSLA